MKKLIDFLILSVLFACSTVIHSQTDPGTDNLMHLWTFDDGTAHDSITTNPINGSLVGGATIENKALVLSSEGQYLSFSGPDLDLNGYSAISQEIWFTSEAGTNTGFTMLSYFGNTSASNGQGYNYVSTSVARGDNKSRTAISDGTYSSEVAADGPEYDDGLLHQLVSVISGDSVILYIDGSLIDKTVNTVSLSTIGSSLAYLGKGGYNADPTWIGSISKFSIYNKPLTADEVAFLYQQGAESSKMIISSRNTLSFDSLFASSLITVSGINLTDSIEISAPAGISISTDKLAPNANNSEVTITYDSTTAVDGYIVLTSGDETIYIYVKSYSNSCYEKFYPDIPNLIVDPYLSNLSNFTGWGNYSINNDSTYVYCGASSGKVSGSGGWLIVNLTDELQLNTQYRLKAKVLTIDGSFRVGIYGWSEGMPDYAKAVNTSGSWEDIDLTFTTGESLDHSQGVFLTNSSSTGKIGYIDNWEMYASPKVYTSKPSLTYLEAGYREITIRGVNLLEDITVTAPAGFDVSSAMLPAGSDGEPLTVTYNGISTTSGYVYFTSGTTIDSLFVSGSIDPLLISSVASIRLDEIDTSASFSLTGYNLAGDVSLEAPEGISVSALVLPSSIKDSTVTLTYDGIANSSGYLITTSGTAKDSILLIAANNAECFEPLYTDKENLIVDPTCNYYLTDGWGHKSINADPDFVYCGARSGMINNGSYDRNLTGILKPNKKYRMRANVYKETETGENMGNVTYTLGMDSASYPDKYQLIKTAMDSACSYFNKHTPFVENIYVYYSPGIPTAQASYHGSIGFGPNTRYMWVGTAIHEMAHYFGSGTTTIWKSKIVNKKWTGTAGNALLQSIGGGTVINGDAQHYWPYGINQKEEITNLGSLAVQDKALADAVRIIKAMLVDDCDLPTNNPSVGLGVYGYDATKGDVYQEVEVPNSWQEVDFTFVTGENLKASHGVFFNSGKGYIDNWELYEFSMDATLKEIFVDGVCIDLVPDQYEYLIVLPDSITEVPTVTATTSDTEAMVVAIVPAASLPGVTSIEVRAEDLETVLTYTINFEYPPIDYTLKDLQVDGLTVDGFNPDTLTYNIELPAGTTNLPVVTATPSDADVTFNIVQAEELPGSAHVIVEAEDGSTELTYTVNFTVKAQSSLANTYQGSIKVFPTASSGDFTVRTECIINYITVYGTKGDIVLKQLFDGPEFKLTIPKAGIYILKVENEMATKTFKVFKMQ